MNTPAMTQAQQTLMALIAENANLRVQVASPQQTIYVTSLADSGPGTLREALSKPDATPTRIRSRIFGTIRLAQRIYAYRSNAVLDIPELLVTGGAIDWQAPCFNIEVANLRMDGCPDDGLFFRPNVDTVYVHHSTFAHCADEELACGAKNARIEYNIFRDALPPTGGGLWTVTDSGADHVSFKRNLFLNIFKRLGNANAGVNIQNFENVAVNCANAPFCVTGTEMDVWHNIYYQGQETGLGIDPDTGKPVFWGDWNLLKSNGGIMRYGKNYQIVGGVATDMNLKIDPTTQWTLPTSYIKLGSPQSDDFDWKAQVTDVFANAGASIKNADDLQALSDGLSLKGHISGKQSDYK